MEEFYDIFISYRREGGYDTAKHLYDLLIRDGYRVSFDIDTLRSGDFDVQLYERIDQCRDFILIVDQHAFDRMIDANSDPKKDWLRCELAYALQKGKNVIPVFLSGTNGFPDNLPADVQNVAMKNGPEFNRYHFNSFYDILKKRFLHKLPFYRHKQYVAYMLIVVVSLIVLPIVLSNSIRDCSRKSNITIETDTSAIISCYLPDYKTQIREKYENQPDLEPAYRADIVVVIKAFLENTDTNTCPSWSVFSEFTKNHQIIPLSQGIVDECDSGILPYRLDFIAKLVYKGENLNSDINGLSTVQDIYLGGPRMGPFLLVINSGHSASYTIGGIAENIILDAGFIEQEYKRVHGISYTLYKNNKECVLVLVSSGGSGGDFFEWVISYDQDLIIKYLDGLDIFNYRNE